MRQRRDAALRSLKLMLVASVALPLLLFCYAAWANYHAAFELADERIERAGDIAAEQALRCSSRSASPSTASSRLHAAAPPRPSS